MFTGTVKTIKPMDKRSGPSTPADLDSVFWRVTGADKERIQTCRFELQTLFEVRRRFVVRRIDTEEIDRQIVVFYAEIEEVLERVCTAIPVKGNGGVS